MLVLPGVLDCLCEFYVFKNIEVALGVYLPHPISLRIDVGSLLTDRTYPRQTLLKTTRFTKQNGNIYNLIINHFVGNIPKGIQLFTPE